MQDVLSPLLPTRKTAAWLRKKYKFRESTAAFSLVEVVFALAVMTFACLILLGLLPGGLQAAHRAISTTIRAQIMQSVVNSSEIESYPPNGIFTNSSGVSPAVYYFDNEGTLLANNTSNCIYTATVTSTDLYLPGAPGGPSVLVQRPSSPISGPGVAALLQVVITAVDSPNNATTNTLVWPNTGT